MITITEKDGSTIIVVENPTGSEQRIIEQARKLVNGYSSSFWTKNNEMRGIKTPEPVNVQSEPKREDAFASLADENGFINLDDFEEIISADEVPF